MKSDLYPITAGDRAGGPVGQVPVELWRALPWLPLHRVLETHAQVARLARIHHLKKAQEFEYVLTRAKVEKRT